MPLNPSQIINNLKKSFNGFLATELSGENINFDQDPFETGGLTSWFSVRYMFYRSEPVGVGDYIDDDTDTKGRFHILKCELSAWSRDDEQRVDLGDMADMVMEIAEAESITLYDYDDPEDPESVGKIKIQPGDGNFSPVWGGASGGVLKSSGDMHADLRLKGYVQEITLSTIAEV